MCNLLYLKAPSVKYGDPRIAPPFVLHRHADQEPLNEVISDAISQSEHLLT